MTPTERYLSTFLFIAALIIIATTMRGCQVNRDLQALESSYSNDVASLEADRLFLLDSVDALNAKLKSVEAKRTTEIQAYTKLSRPEKNKRILGLDSTAVITDSSATISNNGIDSINKLVISYQVELEASKLKYTIISAQSEVISKDSIIISKLHNEAKAQKKAAKIKLIKTAVISCLVGLVIGLVI